MIRFNKLQSSIVINTVLYTSNLPYIWAYPVSIETSQILTFYPKWSCNSIRITLVNDWPHRKPNNRTACIGIEGFSVAAYCVGEDLGRQANLLFPYSTANVGLWHSSEEQSLMFLNNTWHKWVAVLVRKKPVYFQLISDVTSPVCRSSAAAAISALSLFHRGRRRMGRFKSLFSLSLSNGNANVHPSGSGAGHVWARLPDVHVQIFRL